MRSLMLLFLASSVLLPAQSPDPASFPHAEISNGALTVKLLLPDADRGYYRGTRFDWSGVIYSLTYKGHEFFGQWFPKYDPQLHDAIMGPAEEFVTNMSGLGYQEAKPGDTFVRIGVGSLQRLNEKPFNRFATYPILNPGKWVVRPEKDRITFIQELRSISGYAYEYTKVIRFDGSKPEMLIEHRLKNTGKKPIETSVYNHNFFMFDNKPTGPGASVTFNFEPRTTDPFKNDVAQLRGTKIVFTRELQPGGESVQSLFDGAPSAKNYDIVMEHRDAGTGVHIIGDHPIENMVFWAIRTTFCPEAYIHLTAAPGKEAKFTLRYRFYELKSDK